MISLQFEWLLAIEEARRRPQGQSPRREERSASALNLHHDKMLIHIYRQHLKQRYQFQPLRYQSNKPCGPNRETVLKFRADQKWRSSRKEYNDGRHT
jgi:hypothetical protein